MASLCVTLDITKEVRVNSWQLHYYGFIVVWSLASLGCGLALLGWRAPQLEMQAYSWRRLPLWSSAVLTAFGVLVVRELAEAFADGCMSWPSRFGSDRWVLLAERPLAFWTIATTGFVATMIFAALAVFCWCYRLRALRQP